MRLTIPHILFSDFPEFEYFFEIFNFLNLEQCYQCYLSTHPNKTFFRLKRPVTQKIKFFKSKIDPGPNKKQPIWLKSYNLHFYAIDNISSSSSAYILYLFQV